MSVEVTEQKFNVSVDEGGGSTFQVVVTEEGVQVVTVGIQGPVGPAGQVQTYVHTQSVPSATWVIQHNLHRYPSVSIVDSSGNVVIPNVSYDTDSSCTVTFSSGFSGVAYLN